MLGRAFITGIGAIVSLLFVATPSLRAQDLLRKPVREFLFHGNATTGGRAHVTVHGPGSIHEALHDLASHAEVPICIESVPLREGEPIVPIEVKVKRTTTVEEILRQIVHQDLRYEYRQRLGVIEVLPVGADNDPTDCLNMVIPEFHVNQPWKYVEISLRCEIEILSRNPHDIVPDPIRAERCGGSFPVLPHPPPKVIDAIFKARTLRDVLDELCARVGNMAWDAYFKNPIPRCESTSVIFYQPKVWYPSDTDPLTWTEGLPKKCTGCHYHRPAPAD